MKKDARHPIRLELKEKSTEASNMIELEVNMICYRIAEFYKNEENVRNFKVWLQKKTATNGTSGQSC